MKLLRSLLCFSLSLSLIAVSPGLGGYVAMAGALGSANSAVSVSGGAGGTGSAGAGARAAQLRLGGPAQAVRLNLANPGLPGGLSAPDLRAAVSLRPAALSVQPALIQPAAQAAGFAAPVRRVADEASAVASPGGFAVPLARAPPAALRANAPFAEQRNPAAAREGRAPTALEGLRVEIPDFKAMSLSAARAVAGTDFLSRVGVYRAQGGEQAVLPSARGIGSLSRNGGLLKADETAKDKDQGMPDYRPEPDRRDSVDLGELDELGNPRRRQSPGPDDVGGSGGFDENGGRERGSERGSPLFGFFPGLIAGSGLFVGSAFASVSLPAMIGVYLGIVVPSLVFHEMVHAVLADRLGDPSAKLAGRADFKFWTPRFWVNFAKHVDPIETLVVPLTTLILSMHFLGLPLIFGRARPVVAYAENLAKAGVNGKGGRSGTRGMLYVALGGPSANFAIAGALGLAHTALLAAGLVPALLPILAIGLWFNVILGLFNLLPFLPLDGHMVGRWLLEDVLGRKDWAEKVYGRIDGELFPEGYEPGAEEIAEARSDAKVRSAAHFLGLIGTIMTLGAPLLAAAHLLAGLFLAGSTAVAAPALLASAAPAALGLALLAGNLETEGRRGVLPPNAMGVEDGPRAPSEEVPDSVRLVVRFEGSGRVFTQDMHLEDMKIGGAGAGLEAYSALQTAMAGQISYAAGLRITGAEYGATPVATYSRINTATLEVPKTKAAALRAALEAKGHKVYENERREIIRPIEDDPQSGFKPADADTAGPVTMEETLKISHADEVQAIAKAKWGSPFIAGARAGILGALFTVLGVVIPQPAIGVIDTGVEKSHRLIAPHLKAAKDVNPAGDGADDNGHGSWVTSMIANYAPWSRNITHYKAFKDGGATLDDVLKGLTMAGNDKNIVISNSWGSGNGDPDSPDSLLVHKLAEEGHIMVFAAGNSGQWGRDSIGSPAIKIFRTQDGTPRIIAVAATMRDGMRASFSSRGYKSQKTKTMPDYPEDKPNAAEQGNDTEGAWLGGRTRAISGTSMSTPKLAGTIALLAMLFGVTEVGEKLDKIVKAVMDTLTNERGQPRYDIGQGFVHAKAAYDALIGQGISPLPGGGVRGAAARAVVWLLGWGRRPAPPASSPGGPSAP